MALMAIKVKWAMRVGPRYRTETSARLMFYPSTIDFFFFFYFQSQTRSPSLCGYPNDVITLICGWKRFRIFQFFFCKSMFTAMGSLVVVFFSRNLQILGSDVDVDRMPTMISLRWKQTNKQTSQKSKQKQNVARRLTELKLISNFQVNQSARLIGETGQPIREAFCFLFDFWKWFWSIGFVGAYAALDYLHGRLLQRRTHQMIKEKEREREREKDKKKKEDKFFVFLLFFVFSVPEKKIPSR